MNLVDSNAISKATKLVKNAVKLVVQSVTLKARLRSKLCLVFPTLHFYSLVFPVFLLSFSVSFCLSDLSVGILPFFIIVPRLLKAAKTHPHPT